MSGKSKEEVAFDLLVKLKGSSQWGERNEVEVLELYGRCLDATNGQYGGATPVAAPVEVEAPAPVAAPIAAPVPPAPPTPQPAQLAVPAFPPQVRQG